MLSKFTALFAQAPTDLFVKQRQYKQISVECKYAKIKFYDSNHKLRSNLKTYLEPLLIELYKVVARNWYGLCCWNNLNTVSGLYWCPSCSQNVVTLFRMLKLHLSSWDLSSTLNVLALHVYLRLHLHHISQIPLTWLKEKPGWALFGGLGCGLFYFPFPLKIKMSNLLKKKVFIRNIRKKILWMIECYLSNREKTLRAFLMCDWLHNQKNTTGLIKSQLTFVI